eukprot:CAMPEP_0203670982 /NCGR_PEP_ID=MMETSP0090-20130426/6919_1 /ASSEMBLY_ACC=CAM_ASM_001088 /TAXON_ID=426623 /ORGANISM="Chaetoceros affinis, Strain CCMP159" /LENGTH=327 /DNA_ID=CAMNT_0050535977 /DNA_START=21 /DNA_END=1004 /DNA_ORIENTATION=-
MNSCWGVDRCTLLFLLSTLILYTSFDAIYHRVCTNAFVLISPSTPKPCSSTSLYGAFNKRNKQGDLMKKMQEAKRQREMAEGGNYDDDDDDDGEDGVGRSESAIAGHRQTRKSDEEIKRENDIKRFEQLLNSESATINYGIDGSTDNYLTKKQEESEVDAGFKGLNRIFEGDPAKTEPFQDLIRIENGNAIGEAGTKRLLPWLNKNTARHLDYLVIISDPRPKSSELRSGMKSLMKLPPNILNQLIVINADTPAENRRYLKKQGMTSINVFCDEKREWMREYTALGEKRWAMCMFIVADGRVQKLVRELDSVSISSVVQNAITSLSI